MQTGQPYTKFVKRLESIVELSSEDIRLLSEMPTSVRSYGADQDIVREGDTPDLHSLHLSRMDHNLTSLGSSVVAFIPHSYFREALPRSQQLTHALWRETLVDAAVYREWVVNVGAREAIARVAHLLCELKLRLQVVGLVQDSSFTIPCR